MTTVESANDNVVVLNTILTEQVSMCEALLEAVKSNQVKTLALCFVDADGDIAACYQTNASAALLGAVTYHLQHRIVGGYD
jgi:hypothetical protein